MEIDPTERKRPSLSLLLEMPEVISVPRSNKRVKLKMGNENDMFTNLRAVWKLLRPSWCPQPSSILELLYSLVTRF